jgi:hypothetical protein
MKRNNSNNSSAVIFSHARKADRNVNEADYSAKFGGLVSSESVVDFAHALAVISSLVRHVVDSVVRLHVVDSEVSMAEDLVIFVADSNTLSLVVVMVDSEDIRDSEILPVDSEDGLALDLVARVADSNTPSLLVVMVDSEVTVVDSEDHSALDSVSRVADSNIPSLVVVVVDSEVLTSQDLVVSTVDSGVRSVMDSVFRLVVDSVVHFVVDSVDLLAVDLVGNSAVGEKCAVAQRRDAVRAKVPLKSLRSKISETTIQQNR